MAEMDLAGATQEVSVGNDSIVVINALGYLGSGVVLSIPAGFAEEAVKGGHIIVQDNTSKEYEPLGVTAGAYNAITDKTVVGVARATVTTTKPFVAVVTMGQINEAACPYPVTQAIKDALSNIQFQ